NILTRSRLAAQAALQARTEHLAMMSRGLAHDLKNLITPISSFLVHTEASFPSDSAAAEVHSDAKRSVRLMTDYIRESLFFANRLSPRFEHVNVRTLLQEVCALTASHAAKRGVEVTTAIESVADFTADRVLMQRLLVNLVGNA